MAAPVLTPAQREKLLEWLVAGFPESLLYALMRAEGFPELDGSSITHYRGRYKAQIQAAVDERAAKAWDAGLAIREVRVKALVDHAKKLESLMWLPDEKGKLHNEKAYRETLDDIAKEMGHRATNVNATLKDEAIKSYGGFDPHDV